MQLICVHIHKNISLMMMTKLCQERQQHAGHSGHCIPHLRSTCFPLRTAIRIPIHGRVVVVCLWCLAFLHSVHRNISVQVVCSVIILHGASRKKGRVLTGTCRRRTAATCPSTTDPTGPPYSHHQEAR